MTLKRPFSTAVLAVVINIALSHSVNAQTVAESYREAVAEFTKIASVTETVNTMPRLGVESVEKIIKQLSDENRYLENPTDSEDHLAQLVDVCSNSNVVVMSYQLFRLNTRVDANADEATQVEQLNAVMQENIAEYQDELTLLQPFLFRCMKKQIPLLSSYIESIEQSKLDEARVNSLRRAKLGSYRSYVSALLAVQDTHLKMEYRQALITALADAAPEFAYMLPPPARSEIIANSSGEFVDDSVIRQQVGIIVDAMSISGCSGLCQW
ncbi:MAG: hypothetical protein KTR35_00180 [Gammaproteobacteria bacterium]|nr:hypothetical protein [Gammaproteobacteria bacterium]